MSKVDHQHLLDLARVKSAEGRAILTETIINLFDDQSDQISDRERTLMYGILRSVIREVEMEVRRQIAEHLAGRNDAPPDLAALLANDEIDVAYPMLTRSGILKDEDLIEVIHHRSQEHQLAVAIRNSVSEQVSQALVETGNEKVVVALLNNENAEISQNTMAYLVEQSRRVDTYQEPILRRDELLPEMAERMMTWVSAALRAYIVENFDIDPIVIDDAVEKAAGNLKRQSRKKPRSTSGEALADALSHGGLATTEVLISTLRQGEVSLFLAMFCKLTGLREYLAKRILFEPGGEGLAICCRAVGLDKEEFASIFRLSQAIRMRGADKTDAALAEISWLYDDTSQDAALNVLKTWRRNKGYLSALRQIQMSRSNSA